MKFQGIDKFEYKYIKLKTSLQNSIDMLNKEGEDGWELIDLEKPTNIIGGDIYKGLMKRRITEIEV